MGIEHLPRAYFRGCTYWNPSTMNNNDYQPTYDVATARLNWPWLERHGVSNDEEFDAYVTQSSILQTPNDIVNPNEVASRPPAEWNFYGGNGCGFVDDDEPEIEWPEEFTKPSANTTLTGFTNLAGERIRRGDPWIGQRVRMNPGSTPPKLVDVDPFCPWSSQIFVDTFSTGDFSQGPGFKARTAGRAHARWIGLRNLNSDKKIFVPAGVFSATFQLGLPSESIEFFESAPPSGTLARQLRAALDGRDIQGLMVRMSTYLTIHFQGTQFAKVDPNPKTILNDCLWIMSRLYAVYAQGLAKYQRGEQTNPPPLPVNRAYSRTVGWIAPWIKGELRSMPGGRVVSIPKATDILGPALGPAAIGYVADLEAPDRIARLSVDLGTTIPESDSTGVKKDLGPLLIGLTDVNGNQTIIAKIPYTGGYDQPAYEATAGVIDIPADSFITGIAVKDIESQSLYLSFESLPASRMALIESDFVAETDDRAVYLDQPDAPWSGKRCDDRSISIQIRYRGGKPPQGTQLSVAQYAPTTPGMAETDGWRLVSLHSKTAQSPYIELSGDISGSGDGYVVVTVPHPSGGKTYSTVDVNVRGIRSGTPALAFSPVAPNQSVPDPPPTVKFFPDIRTASYAVVRVLPFHNSMAQNFEEWLKTGPSIDLVTQRVFDDVFKTYFLMYPVMRFIRDPLQFQTWRARVLEVTDSARFESSHYMPVTRSLSAGQRRMLVLWNQYANGELRYTSAPAPIYGSRA